MIKDAEHIGVWGRSGSGKSTLVKRLLGGRSRVVIFDMMDEYGAIAPAATDHLSTLVERIARNWRGGFRLRFLPAEGDPAEQLNMLAGVLARVQEPYRDGRDDRKITLVAEELAASYPNVRRASAFTDLCQRGRHYGIELIGTSQRMADVNMAFRGNTSADYFFALRAAADYQAAGTLIGQGNVETLRGLKQHEYLKFARGEVTRGKNPLRIGV